MTAPALPTGNRRAQRGVLLGSVLLFAGLFAATAVHLSHVRWYPVLDLALTELRIRDVASGNPPLVGLIGRIGSGDLQGSHPGPLSFYFLWPLYQLFGGTAWAMEAATCAANAIAIGLALWCAFRRGGAWMVGALTPAIAIAIYSLGPFQLSQAWNPYLPILWWFTFATAAWCVLCDDVVLLPIVVFAGSMCVQTHISYALLVLAPSLVVVAILVAAAIRDRRLGRRDRARTRAAWVAFSAVLGVLLWLPPLWEQVQSPHGNLTIIWDYFSNPPERTVGFATGWKLLLRHLDLGMLLDHGTGTAGPTVPGLMLLVVWLVTAVVAWRRRMHVLAMLNVVIAVSLLAGLVSLSRIFGPPFWYLMLWGWSLAALMLCSTLCVVGSTADALLGRRAPVGRGVAAVVLVTATVAASVGFLHQVSDVHHASAPDSQTLAALMPKVGRALASDRYVGAGRAGHYIVTWYDPIGLGGLGYGMMDELERQGYDVGTLGKLKVAVTGHRVMPLVKVTAELHLALGNDVEVWRRNPDAHELAHYDGRSPLQRQLSDQLRARAVAGMRDAGIQEPAKTLEDSAFLLLSDSRLSVATREAIRGYLALGLPASVFVTKPGVPGSPS